MLYEVILDFVMAVAAAGSTGLLEFPKMPVEKLGLAEVVPFLEITKLRVVDTGMLAVTVDGCCTKGQSVTESGHLEMVSSVVE